MNDHPSPPPYVPGPGFNLPPAFQFGPSAPRPRRGWLLALISIIGAVLLGVAGLMVVGLTHPAKPKAARTETAPLPKDPCGGGICSPAPTGAPATVPAAAAALKASDIQLTVKIKTKDCSGTAGCNVEYTIKAVLLADVDPQECEVSYDVHGLTDTQTGTLDFHSDGAYDQDSHQAGETSNSAKKLTATVTEVDC